MTGVNFQEIKKLIDLVMKSGVAELEVKEGEKTVRISNIKIPFNAESANQFAAILTASQAQVMQQQLPGCTTTPTAGTEQTTSAGTGTNKAVIATHTVHAPMVGTVYLSATPGAKHFVEVGQHVKAGDTLCLIEAMKMFNRIEADKSGIITSVLVENAQPVEYEHPLFVIE